MGWWSPKQRALIVVVGLALLLGPKLLGRHDDVEPTDVTDGRFHVGECWQYRTRPHEEGSTLTVLKVEALPQRGTIVHLRVDGVRIASPQAPGGVLNEVAHMPFTERAVADSVTTRQPDAATLPQFADGYNRWRQDRGGVFDIPVAQAVDQLQSIIDGQPRDGSR